MVRQNSGKRSFDLALELLIIVHHYYNANFVMNDMARGADGIMQP